MTVVVQAHVCGIAHGTLRHRLASPGAQSGQRRRHNKQLLKHRREIVQAVHLGVRRALWVLRSSSSRAGAVPPAGTCNQHGDKARAAASNNVVAR